MASTDGRPLTADAYFSAESEFWRAIYSADDVYGLIHQYRKSLVLGWVDELGLEPGSDALEVGCGAGLTAVELARRGLRVYATDAVPAMLELARMHALSAGVSDAVDVAQADAQALAFPGASFDLVLAMGVIPWLESPRAAVREMARVLRPGGVLLVNCDNVRRLDHSLDPAWNPRLARARKVVARMVPASWLPAPGAVAARHSIPEFDALLADAGLTPERAKTFGFGPFTLLGRRVVPHRLAVGLHRILQRRADRGSPLFAPRGAQYIVAARKR